MTGPRVEIVADADALARRGAEHIVDTAQAAIETRGVFTMALSGGDTARRLYAMLASDAFADRIDWTRAEMFWGDERCVPPSDPRSNYGMARDVLLARVPVRTRVVHRIHGEDEPAVAAARYEQLLRERFGVARGAPIAPLFDINHLGMGADGHTASLFPGDAAVAERVRWAIPVRHQESDTWRVTLTPLLLNAARLALVTVSGPAKAEGVHAVLEGLPRPEELPAQVLAPVGGTLIWLLDEAAGALLRRRA